MKTVRCEGWWEQAGYGRQPMNNLHLRMHNGVIAGEGTDVIRPFEFKGTIASNGQVEMSKHYEDRHTVLYLGRYDGEGTMFGEWHIDGLTGNWWIRFLAPSQLELSGESIGEILPV